MTTPDYAGLCERLRAKARASFEANKSFGRRGKEWAIETEPEWQAAAAIESLVAENERMREALKGLVERLLLIHDDPQYIAVWTIFQTHCGPYRGPQYVRELEAARTALQGASDDR